MVMMPTTTTSDWTDRIVPTRRVVLLDGEKKGSKFPKAAKRGPTLSKPDTLFATDMVKCLAKVQRNVARNGGAPK